MGREAGREAGYGIVRGGGRRVSARVDDMVECQRV